MAVWSDPQGLVRGNGLMCQSGRTVLGRRPWLTRRRPTQRPEEVIRPEPAPTEAKSGWPNTAAGRASGSTARRAMRHKSCLGLDASHDLTKASQHWRVYRAAQRLIEDDDHHGPYSSSASTSSAQGLVGHGLLEVAASGGISRPARSISLCFDVRIDDVLGGAADANRVSRIGKV